MERFKAEFPIRKKLQVAFGIMVALMTAMTLVTLVSGAWLAAGLNLAMTIVALVLALQFHHAIADPYVDTVVRMEGLAAGDLTSPIAYTHFTDCVGRMTKAMQTFRDNALDQQRTAAEQTEVVGILAQALGQLREGNLTATIEQQVPQSYMVLRDDFNLALASLRELIGAVSVSAQTIETGSAEIAHASEDLARRTEANAASLQETTTSVAEMDQRLKQTAQAAARTVSRADGAMGTVSGGRVIADEAVSAMGRVSESAKGIDSVIEGLDKIAFQTRVLAMNAAVEAGRAGEAGRGFAVVADLVSALAMRAEEEAGRARDQLTSTQSEILSAVEMVRKVDDALVAISSDVAEVHDLLGNMANDNNAQASAITQISSAIGSMDQATQQNAAMVEETSAAARNLASEVNQLASAAMRFNIGNKTPTARPRAATPAPARAAPKASDYVSPVKALPVTAMAGRDDDWNAF